MPISNDLNQLGLNVGNTIEEEKNPEILILPTEPTDERLNKVINGECVIFEFKMKGLWILYSRSKEINAKGESYSPFNKRINQMEDIAFLDSIFTTTIKNEECIINEDDRKKLLSIAETYNQTTLPKADRTQPEKPTDLCQDLIRVTNIGIDTSLIDDISQTARILINKYQRETNLPARTLDAINSDVLQLLKIYLTEINVVPNNIEDFLKFWISLIFKFSNKFLGNKKINRACDEISEQASQIIIVPLQTFLGYQSNKKNISSEDFNNGTFALSVLLAALLKGSQLVSQFLRSEKNTYNISNITLLNDYNKEKIKQAMTTAGALTSHHALLLCITLIELPLEECTFIKEILQSNMPRADDKLIRILLENPSSQTKTISAKDKKKSKSPTPTNAKKQRKKRKLYTSSDISKEEDLYTEDRKFFKKKIELTDLNTIALSSASESKALAINYFFYEISNILNYSKIMYDLIIKHTSSIRLENVSDIEKEIQSLGDIFYRLSINAIFILLKAFISPIYNSTQGNNKNNLDELILTVSSQKSKELEYKLTEFTEDDFNDTSKLHNVRIKHFKSLSDYIEETANVSFNTFIKRPKFFTNNISLSTTQKVALNLIYYIIQIFVMDDIIYPPMEKDYYSSHVKLTPFAALSSFLRFIFDNNLNKFKYFDRTLMIPSDEIKKLNKLIETIKKIDRQLDSIKNLITYFEHSKNFNRVTENNFLNLEKQSIDCEKKIKEITSQILSCQNTDILAAMQNISDINKKKLYRKCRKIMASGRTQEAQGLVEIFSLFCQETDTESDIKRLVSKTTSEDQSENIDYNALNTFHLKSLNTCLIALKQSSKIQKKYDSCKFSKEISKAKQLYYKEKYNDFLEIHEKWIKYKVNSYQEIEKSIKGFEKSESELKTKISDLEKNTLVIDFNNDIHYLVKKIPSIEKQLDSANKLETQSKYLLESVENIFSEFKYQDSETIWNTKALLGTTIKRTTLSACIEARNTKLNQLAERVDAIKKDIDASELPNAKELDSFKYSLSNIFLIVKNHSDNVRQIKKNLTSIKNRLLELQEICEIETIECQKLKEELEKEKQEFSELCFNFSSFFDTNLFDNNINIISILSQALKQAKKFKFSSSDTFIMLLQTKSQRIQFLTTQLQKINIPVSNESFKKSRDYKDQINMWIKKIRNCLDEHIDSLHNTSQNILEKLVNLNINDTADTDYIKEQLAKSTSQNDSLKSEYHCLLELSVLYKNYSIEIFPERTELTKLYKAFAANQEIIDSIHDALAQKEKHFVDQSTPIAPTKKAPNNFINHEKESKQKSTEKTESSNENLTEFDSKNVALSINACFEENENLAREFSFYSRKILDLDTEAKRSQDTIETLLPKVTLGQGHERLKILLENKIQHHAKEIKSYTEKINSLRKESAILVEEALTNLKPFVSSDEECVDIETLKSTITEPDCSHLSLIEETNDQYALCIEKKSGKPSIFTIIKGGTPKHIIEMFAIAVESQNRLLDRGWYMNQTDFILDNIDNFLLRSNSGINIVQIPSYTDLYGSIMNINLKAKQKIKLYTTPYYNQMSLVEKTQYHYELRTILVELETKLDLFIQTYHADPLLEAHIEELNIAEIKSTLINLITEQEMTLTSFQFINSVPPYTLVPVFQNPSSFFAHSVASTPTVVYATSPLQPGMQ